MDRVRIILISLLLAAFVFSIAGTVEYVMWDERAKAEYYRQQDEAATRGEMTFSGPYCQPDNHPLFLASVSILIGLSLLSIWWFRKLVLSLIFSLSALSMFAVWYSSTQQALSLAESYQMVEGIDWYFYEAGKFDIAVLSVISLVCIVELYAVLTSAIRSLQAKLP